MAATAAVDRRVQELKGLPGRAALALVAMVWPVQRSCDERENCPERELRAGPMRLLREDAKAEIEELAVPVHREWLASVPPELELPVPEPPLRHFPEGPEPGQPLTMQAVSARVAEAAQVLAALQELKVLPVEQEGVPPAWAGEAEAGERLTELPQPLVWVSR